MKQIECPHCGYNYDEDFDTKQVGCFQPDSNHLELIIRCGECTKKYKITIPIQPSIEKLAATQHAIWSHWMQHWFTKIFKDGYSDSEGYTGYKILNSDMIRWRLQLSKPYDHLTEAEKESDRQIVRRFVLGEE